MATATRKSRSTAVTAPEPAAVPALVQPRLDIGSEDVALPRLYIGQHMSSAVQDGLVKPGSIFTALGSDDGDPQVLWEPGQDGGVIFHVLGLRKGKSITADGELQVWDFGDPDAPPEAWTTYQYVIAIPDVDTEIPFKFLLTRTGSPAAKQINLVLKKNEGKGPSWQTAFRLTTAARQNDKGKFFVARVGTVETSNDAIEAAGSLAGLIATSTPAAPAASERSDEPAI